MTLEPSVRDGRSWAKTRRLGAEIASILAAVSIAFAAGAGSPLFVSLQKTWGFADWQLTVAFTVYAVALLLTLLTVGSLSDHVGRRAVLVSALLLMIVSSVLFLTAEGIEQVITARAIQGMATGAATATLTATIVELASPSRKSTMAAVASAAPVGGLALGVLGGGIATQESTRPVWAVFSILIAIFLVTAAVLFVGAETSVRRVGAFASLRPRLQLPPEALPIFRRLTPLIAAGWMTAGFYLGLMPPLEKSYFRIGVGVITSIVVAIQPASSALAALALSRRFGRISPVVAGGLILSGMAVAIAGVTFSQIALVALGAVIGGTGQGIGFSSALRELGGVAAKSERAGLFASAYLVAYGAYGIPVLLAGLLSRETDLKTSSLAYAGVVILLAAGALVAAIHGLSAQAVTQSSSPATRTAKL